MPKSEICPSQRCAQVKCSSQIRACPSQFGNNCLVIFKDHFSRVYDLNIQYIIIYKLISRRLSIILSYLLKFTCYDLVRNFCWYTIYLFLWKRLRCKYIEFFDDNIFPQYWQSYWNIFLKCIPSTWLMILVFFPLDFPHRVHTNFIPPGDASSWIYFRREFLPSPTSEICIALDSPFYILYLCFFRTTNNM